MIKISQICSPDGGSKDTGFRTIFRTRALPSGELQLTEPYTRTEYQRLVASGRALQVIQGDTGTDDTKQQQ